MIAEPTAPVNLSKYIEARFFAERPHVRGRRVPVATLAHSAQRYGWNAKELAYQFTLTEAEVLAALLYYEEHKDEIEAQEGAYQAELDEAYNQAHGKS